MLHLNKLCNFEPNFSSQVNVIVHNQLKQKALTVHWHGIFQTNTYFMDGSAYITQCPIQPGQKFKYQFVATPHGTHWYHPHLDAMRLDGAFGMIVVHKKLPTIPYFSITVNDWSYASFESRALNDPFNCDNRENLQSTNSSVTTNGFTAQDFDCGLSSLFDGQNRRTNAAIPLKEYIVNPNGRIRFRIVNTGVFFPFRLSIDGHKLYIVASDGADIQPILVDSFYVTVSETVDFEIKTDQRPGRYWFRADTTCATSGAKGVLVYKGFEKAAGDPISQPRNCTSGSPCLVFNCPFEHYPFGSNVKCLSVADARSKLSISEQKKTYGINSSNVVELFLNFAQNVGPSVNGRRFMMPMSEPLFQNPWRKSDCRGKPCFDSCSCQCTDIITLPANRTIRLVVSSVLLDPKTPQTG